MFEGVEYNLHKPGEFIIIDPEDYQLLNQFAWRWDKDGYVIVGTRVNKKYKLLRFHRQVMIEAGWEIDNLQVDHINGIRYDNRKSNLRVCTKAENCRNRKGHKKYKGVTFNKRKRLFEARIKVNGRSVFLGSFGSEREAAHIYNQAAKQIHGDYANLNLL